MTEIWNDLQIVGWTQILLNSYQQLIGSELIERDRSLLEQSKWLYTAPFVVVSHDTQNDPVLTYGNQAALDLWEMDWETLTQTRSKNTAELMNQAKRQEMLALARKQGFIPNYQGIRISRSGRRFEIDRATIWNLTDAQGQPCGQAATFADWKYL